VHQTAGGATGSQGTNNLKALLVLCLRAFALSIGCVINAGQNWTIARPHDPGTRDPR
jgi:hypothetical protein